eukprot:UN29281
MAMRTYFEYQSPKYQVHCATMHPKNCDIVAWQGDTACIGVYRINRDSQGKYFYLVGCLDGFTDSGWATKWCPLETSRLLSTDESGAICEWDTTKILVPDVTKTVYQSPKRVKWKLDTKAYDLDWCPTHKEHFASIGADG